MVTAKTIILGICIAIVLAFFFGYGISAFYKSPKMKNFCKEGEFFSVPVEAKNCNCTYIEPDKKLKEECTEKEGQLTPKYDKSGCIESYSCEMCYKEFRDIQEIYNRNVFVITIILGLIAIIIGAFLKLPSVSAGIMGGGTLTIIYGTIRYWGFMPDFGRFTILGIALAILIWIGYKKFRK